MSGVEVIFGVVTGATGLLSLAIELGESAAKLKRLYHAVKDSPKAIEQLSFDLETMGMALFELEKIRQRDSFDSAILARCITRCQQSTAEIQELVNNMESCIAKHSRIRGRLYAAFREWDVKVLLDDLERAKTSLHLAYSMYHTEQQIQRHQEHRRMLTMQSHRSDDILQELSLLSQSLTPPHRHDLAGDDGQSPKEQPTCVCPHKIGDIELVNNSEHPHRVQGQLALRPGKREKSGTRRRVQFRLPAWLCERVWDLTLSSDHSRRSMHLYTYNVVPHDSAIFKCCRKGDINGLRGLIQSGAASLLDVNIYYKDPRPETTIEVAASHGQLVLCQYILAQTTWPDQAMVLNRSLASYSITQTEWRRKATFDEHMHRLFFTAKGFDADHDDDHDDDDDDDYDRSGWLRNCLDMRSLSFVLKFHYPHFFNLSASKRLELAIQKGIKDISTTTDFVGFLGMSRSDQKLATLRTSDGTTVLHYVASRIYSMRRNQTCGDLQDWLSFGACVVKMGADLCSIAYDARINGRRHTYLSPLMVLLRFWNHRDCLIAFDRGCSALEVLESLRLWTGMIQQGGVDLCDYGVLEAETWKSIKALEKAANTKPGEDCYATMIVEQLQYGPRPADWSLMLSPIQPYCLYKLHQLPGDIDKSAGYQRRSYGRPRKRKSMKDHGMSFRQRR